MTGETKNKQILERIQTSMLKITEFVTGLLGSDQKDHVLAAGRVLQAGIKLDLLKQLSKEIKEYTEKGKIKPNWDLVEKNRASFLELLNCIDEESPDEIKFNAIKSVFLSSISINNNQEDSLNYQLLKITKKLTSGDILVLKALYEIANDKDYQKEKGISDNFSVVSSWLNITADYMGHKIPSLVEHYEDNLMNLKLISNRTHSDLSGFNSTPYFRLTKLGHLLCQHIIK